MITNRSWIVGAATLLLVASPSFAGGPNGRGLISSADILAPFACESNDAVACEVIGTSTLYRTAKGVGVNIVATEFGENYPYTVWIVVFNKPNKCAAFPHGPCGFGDLGNPRVGATIFWATGNYTDGDGNGFFQAYITKGPNSRIQLIPGELVNPRKAEIHFIYRRHPKGGDEYEAINTPAGSCPDGVIPPAEPDPDKELCLDIASSIHLR